MKYNKYFIYFLFSRQSEIQPRKKASPRVDNHSNFTNIKNRIKESKCECFNSSRFPRQSWTLQEMKNISALFLTNTVLQHFNWDYPYAFFLKSFLLSFFYEECPSKIGGGQFGLEMLFIMFCQSGDFHWLRVWMKWLLFLLWNANDLTF